MPTSLFIVVLLMALICGGAATIYAWSNRAISATRWLGFALFALFFENINYWLLLVTSPDTATAYLTLNLVGFGVWFAAPLFFFFCWEYTLQVPLPRWLIGCLLVIPTLIVVIGGSPIEPSPLYVNIEFAQVDRYTTVYLKYGGWIAVAMSHTLLLYFFSAGLLTRHSRFLPAVQSRFHILLVFGLLCYIVLLPLDAPNPIVGQFSGQPLGSLILFSIFLWIFYRHQWLRSLSLTVDMVLQGLRSAVLVLDGTGNLLQLNHAAEHLLSRTIDDVQGTLIIRYLPLPSRWMTPPTETITEDWVYRQRVYAVRRIPLQHRDQILGQWLFLEDVTERRQLELDLRLQTQALNSVHDAVTIIDVQNEQARVTYINSSFTALTGYQFEEARNQDIRYIQQIDESQPEYEQFLSAIQQGKSTRLTLSYYTKDGRLYYGDTKLDPVHGVDDQISHFVITSEDITERQLAEKKQSKLLADIESANRQLNDFAYVVAHDLKAPLRTIQMMSDWLQQDYQIQLDMTGQDLLRTIQQRTTRMTHLIDDLLRYAKIGQGGETLINVSLQTLIREVIVDLLIPPGFQVTIAPDFPKVYGEPTHLRQIFQNLIGNAVKYMDKPNGQIKINFNLEEGEMFWRFAISDNGPGIAPHYHEKIFQVFQTLNPNQENADSTGIGLAIVKKIVESYRGRVWVESAVGKGTTFYFTFPVNLPRLLSPNPEEPVPSKVK
jgi:PAS domain S-box-containing protein